MKVVDGPDKTLTLEAFAAWLDDEIAEYIRKRQTDRAEMYLIVQRHLAEIEPETDAQELGPERERAVFSEIARARKMYVSGMGGDVEVDDDAAVSRGPTGTWVAAWVWLSKQDDLGEEGDEEDSNEEGDDA